MRKLLVVIFALFPSLLLAQSPTTISDVDALSKIGILQLTVDSLQKQLATHKSKDLTCIDALVKVGMTQLTMEAMQRQLSQLTSKVSDLEKENSDLRDKAKPTETKDTKGDTKGGSK